MTEKQPKSKIDTSAESHRRLVEEGKDIESRLDEDIQLLKNIKENEGKGAENTPRVGSMIIDAFKSVYPDDQVSIDRIKTIRKIYNDKLNDGLQKDPKREGFWGNKAMEYLFKEVLTDQEKESFLLSQKQEEKRLLGDGEGMKIAGVPGIEFALREIFRILPVESIQGTEKNTKSSKKPAADSNSTEKGSEEPHEKTETEEERKGKEVAPKIEEPKVETPPELEQPQEKEEIKIEDEEARWEQFKERAEQTEATPLEQRNKLKGLVGKFYEGAKEKVSGIFEKKKEYLNERNAELSEKSKELGPRAEGFVRFLGEKYNKLNWKYKIAIGAGLGIGATVFSGVSAPIALICGVGIGAQRVAGGLGMFLKFEKHLQETGEGNKQGFFARQEWYKKIAERPERQRQLAAAIMAASYTIGMSAAFKEAIHLASESSYGEAVHEWLKNHWPFSTATTVAPSASAAVASHEAAAPDMVNGETVPADLSAPDVHVAPEVPATPEMPHVSVDASSGHGYEFMAKRLYEQLHAQHLDPNKFAADSDIHKLLTADATSIDKVVHQIAADPHHGFFNPETGTSVQINLHDQMTIDSDGQIHLGDTIHAPADAHVTPAYHPNVEAQATPVAEPPTSHPEVPTHPAEAPTTPTVEAKTMPVTQEHPATVETRAPTAEPQTPAEASTPPAPVESAVQETVTNHFGLKIPMSEPHIYEVKTPAGEIYRTVFGGSDEARFKFAQDFLTRPENQGTLIRFVHTVHSVFGNRIQIDEIGAETTAGHTSWLANFFTKPVEPPDPKDFGKIIK
jgi:hypothetical protein